MSQTRIQTNLSICEALLLLCILLFGVPLARQHGYVISDEVYNLLLFAVLAAAGINNAGRHGDEEGISIKKGPK